MKWLDDEVMFSKETDKKEDCPFCKETHERSVRRAKYYNTSDFANLTEEEYLKLLTKGIR